MISRSVDGRPIVAVRSGGAEPALRGVVFGCIHGDETAGMRVARRLIAARAPHGTGLWVVPTQNPDGVAAGRRGNARGVDLNRNFPSTGPTARAGNTPAPGRSRSRSRGRRRS